MNDRDIFLGKLAELNPGLSPECAGRMYEYHRALTEMNARLNLTAITDPAESAEKHFSDSISAAFLLPERAHVIDVGTGGGFPGVPLKILRPDLKVTLLDSTEKKTRAVSEMCSQTGVDAEVVCMRAEEAGRGRYRGQFDAAVSRAVAQLPVLAELCLPLVRKGGLFIAYKSLDAEDAHATSFCDKLAACPEKTFAAGDRALLVFRKTEKTPDRYPRSFARIKKNPL